jgi:hypothetical protein
MSKAPEQWFYDPKDTHTCTNAFYRFIVDYDKVIGLFMFTITTAAKMDEMQAVAAHALADLEERAKKPVAQFNKEVAFKRVKEYSRILSRDLIVAMANNFQCYLSEILQEVMKKKHEILRSKEQITTEEALQFNRVQDLRAFIADRKINELSYGGLRVVQDFISERLGVEMFATNQQRALLSILVELRNIHTHNRGIVNQLFLNRISAGHPKFSFKLGHAHHVNLDDFVLLSRNAIDVALNLDDTLSTKFKLKRTRYKSRLAKERASLEMLGSAAE